MPGRRIRGGDRIRLGCLPREVRIGFYGDIDHFGLTADDLDLILPRREIQLALFENRCIVLSNGPLIGIRGRTGTWSDDPTDRVTNGV